MRIKVLDTADEAASFAAELIQADAGGAVGKRGRFVVALSGGSTPWPMLEKLVTGDLPWPATHVFQVDERVAPEGHRDRNLHPMKSLLCGRGSLPAEHVHGMPVDDADLQRAARHYARTLAALAGDPPKIDLVQLGLGADGHTASLVPGDPLLALKGSEVGVTRPYQGRRRMTLTYAPINRARRVLWLVTGEAKAEIVARLVDGGNGFPAARVRRDRATIVVDRAAAARISAPAGSNTREEDA